MSMTADKIREAFSSCRNLLSPDTQAIRHGSWTEHLVFMCEEGSTYAEERREKAMRWLGFVQGGLWAHDLAPIQDLKNMNRPDELLPCGCTTHQFGCLSRFNEPPGYVR